uniref:TNF family profile domain-containing protein n=1 Tax=Branchiostoma floridae TaxID=7739 RepID=C3YE67_BRAFL|eukprot:XP_002605365.1 hypothetical protein BRAFLDRAFT_74190 [Branchiostoma floridae]
MVRKAEKKFGVGPRTANRWLSDVQCAGNEATLAECTLNTGIGVCASRRRWSAGVKCQDEKFTHWEEMEEPNSHFALDNGDLKVTEEGQYLIYSQVGVANDQYDSTFKYSVLVHETPFLTCESSAGGSPPRYTCYTAGVRYLRGDDTISLMMECDRCKVSTAEDTTFFGVIKLSANLDLRV